MRRSKRSWWRWVGVGLVLVLVAAVIGAWRFRPSSFSFSFGTWNGNGPRSAPAREPAVARVRVVRPKAGGIPRTIQQPASINSFESVDLYAMVSGYLKKQDVDIGSRIKKGEVLAEIHVPRDAKTVDEAASLVEQARAQVVQAEARIKMAEAQRDAMDAAAKVAESDVERLVARRHLAEKQFARISGLARERATTSLVVDEQQSDLESAAAAERTGRAEILSARAKLLGAQAAIDQAKADAVEAGATLRVNEARFERLKVNLQYAKIVAPFDGVVTHRTFHPGALIRSATEGGQPLPLLTVKRIDVMRVVVLVPDRDVVLTKVGDQAVVSVDALDGQSFTGTLARIARSEDAQRLMRVEIDLPNPHDLLFDGMYGKAIISLERNGRNLALPAACVVEHNGRSGGAVFVVRAGVVRRVEVKLGGDNGTDIEVVSGLGPNDDVVLPAGAPVEDGMRVALAP